eukprot:3975485-Prymnesium_polylepis.1
MRFDPSATTVVPMGRLRLAQLRRQFERITACSWAVSGATRAEAREISSPNTCHRPAVKAAARKAATDRRQKAAVHLGSAAMAQSLMCIPFDLKKKEKGPIFFACMEQPHADECVPSVLAWMPGERVARGPHRCGYSACPQSHGCTQQKRLQFLHAQEDVRCRHTRLPFTRVYGTRHTG